MASGAGGGSSKSFAKVTLLGSQAVGKTSIVRRYCFDKFPQEYKVTLGADFGTKHVDVDGTTATLQVWDTAGQERFNSLGAAFYRGSDACMLVYDVTDARTLDALDGWMDTFTNKAEVDAAEGFPFVVVGNKSDKPRGEHQVTEDQGKTWAEAHNCLAHFQVSAKENMNIDPAFLTVMREVLARQKDVDDGGADAIPDMVDITPSKSKDDGCPC